MQSFFDWIRQTNVEPLTVIKEILRRNKRKSFRAQVPLRGHEGKRNEIEYVDFLSDGDLMELNHLLDWNSFTLDGHGRRFGNVAWKGKRNDPEGIPDRRVLLLHDRFDLSDKHVLEIGCFEGIHTVGLSKVAKKVTAVDARIENVVKTIVRCAFFGCYPRVFKCDIERGQSHRDWLTADIAYHVGTFYHLQDPVLHLLDLQTYVRKGLLLDTHYALENQANETYRAGGNLYRFKRYREENSLDPFSGVYDYSKWLRLADIVEILTAGGFKVDILEKRDERNGPRVLLVAERA